MTAMIMLIDGVFFSSQKNRIHELDFKRGWITHGFEVFPLACHQTGYHVQPVETLDDCQGQKTANTDLPVPSSL